MSNEHGVHINRKEYWVIFVWLTLLTVLEVIVAQMPIAVNLMMSGLILMAVSKAALVALFYMHLKHETRILRWTVAIPMLIPPFYALVLIGEVTWRMLR